MLFGVIIVNFEWILTPSIISIVNFEPVFVYWATSEYYFFIQEIRLKF